MSINSFGTVSGNLVLTTTVGADIQQYSLLQRQWVTYWDKSICLGQRSYSYSFIAVPVFQSGVNLAISGSGIAV